MKIIESKLRECLVIEPNYFEDPRGAFYESWNKERFETFGLKTEFAQSNVSISKQNVLRGLHYQWPRPQGKLVSVIEGEVYDVAIDIRRGSPTFGKSAAAILSADNHRHFWIPEGFAHGFVVLSERAVFTYLCSDVYIKECDASIRWNDAQLAIDWPVSVPLLSEKDATAPFLADISEDRLPVYRS